MWFRVVSAVGRFGHESFRLGHFGLGPFGLILGWVVSAYFVGSFRPDIPRPPPISFNINETAQNDKFSFMTSHNGLSSVVVSKFKKDDDTFPNPYK